MCDDIKTERVRCDVCRTINLAKHVKKPNPDMQIYEKCSPVEKFVCPRTDEYPLKPTCIRVCTKEDFKLSKTKPVIPRLPHYAHGKLMYAVKAGILVGAVYFTYSQGVWGNQQDVTECLRRWAEYVRSLNTRRPPVFDHCGNVVTLKGCLLPLPSFDISQQPVNLHYKRKENPESLIAPAYRIYKHIVTTCMSGVVKLPIIIKCAYVDYINALEKKKAEEDLERKIKRKSS